MNSTAKAISVSNFTPGQIATFWSKTRLTLRGCMIYKGDKNPQGYSRIEMAGRTARSHRRCLAHRAAYAMTWGSCPADALVLHECDVPECVNPAHLRLGTVKENVADMMAKGRAVFGGVPQPARAR